MRALCGRKSIRPATLRGGNEFSAIKPMWSADANHDILLGMVVTTASRNDSPFLPSPLAELTPGHSWFSLPAGTVVIADWGYASGSNNAFAHRNGGVPVMHKRGLPSGKLHNGIYTAEGAPLVRTSRRWRMPALIPIPGALVSLPGGRLRPGAIRRTRFPSAMTSRRRTQRVTSSCSVGASGLSDAC